MEGSISFIALALHKKKKISPTRHSFQNSFVFIKIVNPQKSKNNGCRINCMQSFFKGVCLGLIPFIKSMFFWMFHSK